MTAQSFNQATRWTNTKEEHCSKIITLMAEYCLCQRVKPIGAPGCPFTSEGDFMDALKAHHAVMTAAMKAKQSTDPSVAAALECAPTYQHYPPSHHPHTYPRTFRATHPSHYKDHLTTSNKSRQQPLSLDRLLANLHPCFHWIVYACYSSSSGKIQADWLSNSCWFTVTPLTIVPRCTSQLKSLDLHAQVKTQLLPVVSARKVTMYRPFSHEAV